ncbi:MAG: ribonuclease HIII [Ignavibacteria bacterium]|nr:ribonuclease HIII [Ignavibacteria bacterium]
MPNFKESAKIILDNHITNLREEGFIASEPILAPFNYQAEIQRTEGNLKLLIYFGKKGNKVILQGNKELKFYQQVYNIIFGKELFSENTPVLIEPELYIGTDESGKGDYFGPLVVAAVFTDPSVSKKLVTVGVKDSKELTEHAISSISSSIKKLEGCVFNVLVINPEKYNLLYNKMGNLNRMLGWAHAKVLENILDVKNAPEAISDKFGNEKYIQNSLQKKGRKLILHQVTKAEKYTAVAAASILARDSFNKWFLRVNKKLNVELPKGASKKVENKAKYIVNKYGNKALIKLVKLHFKTTKKL